MRGASCRPSRGRIYRPYRVKLIQSRLGGRQDSSWSWPLQKNADRSAALPPGWSKHARVRQGCSAPLLSRGSRYWILEESYDAVVGRCLRSCPHCWLLGEGSLIFLRFTLDFHRFLLMFLHCGLVVFACFVLCFCVCGAFPLQCGYFPLLFERFSIAC